MPNVLTILRPHGFESFKKELRGKMERKWVETMVFAHGARKAKQNNETEKQAVMIINTC